MPINDPHMRRLLYVVATGDRNVPIDWFRSLRPQEEVTEPMPMDDFVRCDATELAADQVRLPNTSPGTVCDGITDDSQTTVSDISSITNKFDEFIDVDPSWPTTTTRSIADPSTSTTERFRRSLDNIQRRFKENPKPLESAVREFCRHEETRLDNVAALSSALRRFASPGIDLSRETILVQPASVARRRMPVAGRQRIHAGRPPRSSRAGEHGYAGGGGSGSTVALAASRRVGALGRQAQSTRPRAPHRLADVVASNKRLGSTHSAK